MAEGRKEAIEGWWGAKEGGRTAKLVEYGNEGRVRERMEVGINEGANEGVKGRWQGWEVWRKQIKRGRKKGSEQ